jgi:hypothetical protein
MGIFVLVLAVLAELLLEHEGHFGIDGWFGFQAVYGLLTCVAMVVLAKLLGVMLKRRDDYYDE